MRQDPASRAVLDLSRGAFLPVSLALGTAALTAVASTAAPAQAKATAAPHRQSAAGRGSGATARFTLGAHAYTITLPTSPKTQTTTLAWPERRPTAALAWPDRRPTATIKHRLTVTATNLSGGPDTGGSIFVYNVDNSNLFASGGNFSQGTAKFSVPAGHYWAVGIFMELSGHRLPQQRVVILPQFTVAGNTTVHIAERAASSEVTATTPRPSVALTSTFEIRRPSVTGPVQFWEFNDTGLSLWVSPTTTKPAVGKLQTFTNQQLISPKTSKGVPYEYDLAYQGPNGIIPGQHRVVTSASLATVDARYYQDVRTSGDETRFGLFHDQLRDLVFEADNSFTLPRHQIEYMLGNPSAFWFTSVLQCYPSTPCTGGQNDAVRSFQAGEHLTENWNAYPLHPGTNVNLLGPANPDPTLPSASRAGDLLTLDVTPFSDNQPGHTGGCSGTQLCKGFSPGTYRVDANGVKVAAGHAPTGTPTVHLRVKLPPGVATIRFTLSSTKNGKAYPLSPQTRTVWTWRSVPGSHAIVPKGWECTPTQPSARHCAVQPMMTLGYQVAHLALDGSAPSGSQTIAISAAHLQLAQAAPITSLRAWVSFDRGRTWHLTTVTRRTAGQFTATFTAPAGSYPTLRVRATDAQKGSITETITRAYRVRGSPR